MSFADEIDRIRDEYVRRAREVGPDLYALTNPAALFLHQQRTRFALAALRRAGLLPLSARRVVEVGCGSGGWLPIFQGWGVPRSSLAGIDLDEARVRQARALLCAQRDDNGTVLTAGADVWVGDASQLPWADGAFDLVVQSTLFTSVLNAELRRALAREMLRVLKPGGHVLWYDFAYNNPRNRAVRGIGRQEIAALFPGCGVRLRRVTLAPPLARKLVPWSWPLAVLLEELRVLNTHYLGLIRSPSRQRPNPLPDGGI